MKQMQEYPFDEHVKDFKDFMNRIRAICKFLDTRFAVIPIAWFWRHRFRAIELSIQAQNQGNHRERV